MYDVFLAKDEPRSRFVISSGLDTSGGVKTRQGYMTPEMYRKVAFSEPMVMKAIAKKNRDTLHNWFVIKRLDGKNPVQQDLNILHEFDVDTRFPQKLEIAGKCKDIYGDGWIEKIYFGDTRQAWQPPPENARIVGLKVLNSERITKTGFRKEDMKKKNPTEYYIYTKTGDDDVYFHPDRLIHVAELLPYSKFGHSKIETLKNILHSKMNADTASGEALDWSSRGIRDMTIHNCTPEQRDAMVKEFKKEHNFYVHDEDYELGIHNPQLADPKSYYDYFERNIGAPFHIPQHVLSGVEPGHVTGSEIGTADYQRDVENDQKMLFGPLVEDLYTEVLSSHGRTWRYEIVWNKTFIDELSEGKIIEKRALAAVQLYINRVAGLTECRRIVNDGVIDINPFVIPDDIKEEAEFQPHTPNVEPNKPGPDEERRVVRPLSPISKEMIELLKEQGRKELEEQEKRLEEARRRKKKQDD